MIIYKSSAGRASIAMISIRYATLALIFNLELARDDSYNSSYCLHC